MFLYDDGALYPSPAEAFAFFQAKGARIHHYTVTGQTLTADFGDVENGDMNAYQGADWRNRKKAAGLGDGGLYASVSELPTIVAVCGPIRLISAHYTYVPHFCDGNCKDENGQPFLAADFPFDCIVGTQFANHGPNGEPYDMTLLRPDF